MNDTICYKINNSYRLSYSIVIDEKAMDDYDKSNEIISSSRIYLICKTKGSDFLSEKVSKPEVLYVGETFNKKKRFSSHKKLLKATTLIKQGENLVVYFLQMRFSYIGNSQFSNNPWDIFNEVKDIHSKTSIWLLERFLIKLFKPILNKEHNNSKIKEDTFVRSKLINNDIQYVHLDIGMKDFVFNFTGGHRIETKDWYSFNLLTNEIATEDPVCG